MVNWTFEPQEYLDLGPLGGSLHEVACAIVDDGGNPGPTVASWSWTSSTATQTANFPQRRRSTT
ncbi:hypothetical protein AHiyo8_42680 [Arthrobacter sp. Hiyo8]|nr:hypothetical protein AHiyo8_42680 [Arthrobacter sp. Hiyo8]